MYYIVDDSTDPQWNLAAEEYLFKNFKQSIFRLWRNEPSIIIGLHQNAFAEINLDYVKNNNIPVVRRLTGGGAVFHDLGNVNFTFIDNKIASESTADMFGRFTKPIIAALNNSLAMQLQYIKRESYSMVLFYILHLWQIYLRRLQTGQSILKAKLFNLIEPELPTLVTISLMQ